MTEKHKTHEKIVAQHELKTHEVTEVLTFFKKHGTLLGYGIVALVTAFSITSFLHAKSAQKDAEAGQLLLTADSDEELQLIVDKYPDSSSAPGALLALARSEYEKGAYGKAQTAYNDFMNKYGKHDMASIAAYGQAACLEALGNTDAAVAGYQKVADNHKGSFVEPMALFDKGKLLAKQGKKEEAITAFESTIKADQTGSWSTQAQAELEKLR